MKRTIKSWQLSPPYDDESYTYIVVRCNDGEFFTRSLHGEEDWIPIDLPNVPQPENISALKKQAKRKLK